MVHRFKDRQILPRCPGSKQLKQRRFSKTKVRLSLTDIYSSLATVSSAETFHAFMVELSSEESDVNDCCTLKRTEFSQENAPSALQNNLQAPYT